MWSEVIIQLSRYEQNLFVCVIEKKQWVHQQPLLMTCDVEAKHAGVPGVQRSGWGFDRQRQFAEVANWLAAAN